MVRSLGVATLNSCLEGSWLVQLVNFEKFQWGGGDCILSVYQHVPFDWSPVQRFLLQLLLHHLHKTEAAISDKGFIYLLLLSVDF